MRRDLGYLSGMAKSSTLKKVPAPEESSAELPPPGSGWTLFRAAWILSGDDRAEAARKLGLGNKATTTLHGWLATERSQQRVPKAHQQTMIEIRYGVSRFAWETLVQRRVRLAAAIEEGKCLQRAS